MEKRMEKLTTVCVSAGCLHVEAKLRVGEYVTRFGIVSRMSHELNIKLAPSCHSIGYKLHFKPKIVSVALLEAILWKTECAVDIKFETEKTWEKRVFSFNMRLNRGPSETT